MNRCVTYSSDGDRNTYLRLLQQNLQDAAATILGYCLMTNHVHLIALPAEEESLSVLMRRVNGRYAQYFNARTARTGHLWQNRFFACVLEGDHLWAALRYVECNPVRANMVERANDYGWSSAGAHVTGSDASGILDMEWWRREAPTGWEQALLGGPGELDETLRRCTYAGRPFGGEAFVAEMGERFGRHWVRGRPRLAKASAAAATGSGRDQSSLF